MANRALIAIRKKGFKELIFLIILILNNTKLYKLLILSLTSYITNLYNLSYLDNIYNTLLLNIPGYYTLVLTYSFILL
jgi:hypothetical protein